MRPRIVHFAGLFFLLLVIHPEFVYARSEDVNTLLFDEIRVQKQIGAGLRFQERREEDDIYERTRQISLSGEWAFAPWFSLYLKVPYADFARTDRARVDYWDHIRGGIKFEQSWEKIGIVGGLYGDLARGHNKVGDVPHDIGYLEPYAGLFFDIDYFYITGAVRWNTESNRKLREQDDEEFRRQWFYDVSLGARLRPVTLTLDLRYHNRYDPQDQIKKYLEIAPGLDWHIGSGFHLGFAAIFNTASESKNRGALLSFRKFID